MKILSLISLALGMACLPAHSQLALNTGDVFTYQFSSLPFMSLNPNGPTLASLGLEFHLGTLHAGDTVRYEMFEDTTATAPFASGTVATTVGIPGFPVLGSHWQDLQGSIRLTMLSGSVTLDSFSLAAIRPAMGGFEQFGERIIPVPEPSVMGLLSCTAGVGLLWSICPRAKRWRRLVRNRIA